MIEYKNSTGNQIHRGWIKMKQYKEVKFEEYKNKLLQDSEIKVEYDALQPEFEIIRLMINARINQGITRKELSLKTGITEKDIRILELGEGDPCLSMLKKLAQGLGMQLKIEFVPKDSLAN